MVGHGFLPQITYPTRAVNSSSTIIDDIYSNRVQHNHHSRNILLNISEHFSQFLSVKRNKIDLKTLNVYKQIILNLMPSLFGMMALCKNGKIN